MSEKAQKQVVTSQYFDPSHVLEDPIECTQDHSVRDLGLLFLKDMCRSLDYRLREHQRALKNEDLGSSALAEHVFPRTIKWIY